MIRRRIREAGRASEATGSPQPVGGAMADTEPRGGDGGPPSEMPQRRLSELESLFDVLPDGLLVSDADGRIVLANERLQAITGYRAQELVGQPVEMLLPEGLRETHRRDREGYVGAPHARSMAAGRDFSMRRKDGSELPVDVALSPLEIDGDLLVIGAVRDASERRDAEGRLREAEARYRSIFEGAVEGIFRTTLDGRYEMANPALARMLGYDSPEELIAGVVDVRQLYVEPHGRDEFIREAQEHEALTDYEYEVCRRDGSIIWVSERARSLYDPAGKLVGFEGMTLDVTKRKRAQQDLRRRDAIIEAVSFAAQGFLEAGSWEQPIGEVLARLGRAAEVSRVHVFENSVGADGVLVASQRYEWVGEGVVPHIGDPAMQDFRWRAAGFGPWADRLAAGELIQGHVREMPPAEREVLGAHGVLSLLQVPVFVEGAWWGHLGFDECFREREFSIAEIGALKASAGALGVAIARERAERALRELEARYRTLVEQIPAIVYLAEFGVDGRWLFVSPQIEQTLGYTAEEWMARPPDLASFIHPDDLERVLWDEAHSQATGEPFRSEYRARTRDDRWVWVRDEAVVVRDETGDGLLLQGIMYDVTVRKRAEEELRARAREQAALADLGQRALVGTDLSVFMDHAVSLVAETLDVEYAKILELLPGEQELLLRAGVGWREGLVGRATVPAGTGSQAGYTLLCDEPVVVEDLSTEGRFSAPPLLREHGVVSGVSVVIRGREHPFGVLGADTSRRRTFASDSVHFMQSVANVLGEAIEREQDERSLRESEGSLAHAQSIAHLGSWNWDMATNDVAWSDEMYRIFGLAPEEFGPSYATFLASTHPDDRVAVQEAVRAAIEEKKPYGIDHRIVLPDGSERVVREQAEVSFDELDRPVRMVGTTQDVTEQKRAEDELRESLDLLRKVDAERRRLVAHLVNAQEEERARIASDIHDDPLQKITAVGMRLAILRRELEDPEQRQRVEEVERAVSLTADSLRHLLFEVRPLALDREGLAAALREYLDQSAPDAGFAFSLENGLIEEPAPDMRALCYRVAQQALANVKVHAGASRVEVSLASQEAGVRMRIRDDGVGFAPDTLTAVPGHLGLHDMRERVELAGGWLRIDSSPGTGTSIEFWVPSGA